MGLRILFIGGTPRGFELIKMLIRKKEHVVHAFILQEDAHEPFQVSAHIQKLCRRYAIPSTICKKIDEAWTEDVLAKNIDVAFVLGWRSILPKKLYSSIPLGCLTCHDSLLPYYRGFAPTAWAIINGEKNTGVTLFKIDDKGVDAGPIVGQKTVRIGRFDTASKIYPQIVKFSVKLYEEFLNDHKRGAIKYRKQDESRATYALRRRPEDGQVMWNQEARKVFNVMRALTPPYPYSWSQNQGQKFWITQASLVTGRLKLKKAVAGEIVDVDNKAVVACGRGFVALHEIIDGTKKKINLRRFLKKGTILG